jgi:osmoprotectant transport system permease protein
VIDWGWIGDHLGAMLGRTIQHLQLAAIAVSVGFLISFGLAVLAISYRRTFPLTSGIAGVLYTIPSLAVFAALVSITGLSIYTAEIPLIMYTLVILVRNIVAGFDSVPRDVLEAADGMGYGRVERFRRIVLPLSVPLVIAGLRLASVSTIGLVTITATLGDSFGGLGFFIFEGYQRAFPTEILAGAVPSILLAIGVDIVFVRIQRLLTPWASGQPPKHVTLEQIVATPNGASFG